MTVKLQSSLSEKLKTGEKLRENERNSRMGSFQARKKSNFLVWSFYRTTAGTGQRLRLSLLRLVDSLDCYGLSQWRAHMLYACLPDPTREMVMYYSYASHPVRSVSLTLIVWSLGWPCYSPSVQVFQVLLIRLSCLTKLSLFPHLGDSMFLRSSSICP